MVTRSLFVIVGAMPPDACVDFRHPTNTGSASITTRNKARAFIQTNPQAGSVIKQGKKEMACIVWFCICNFWKAVAKLRFAAAILRFADEKAPQTRRPVLQLPRAVLQIKMLAVRMKPTRLQMKPRS